MTKGIVTAGPSIEAIERRHDRLLVLDVDEVVLHFIAPFSALLEEHGARLTPTSFKLTGNIHSIATGVAITGHQLDQVTEQLYREQETRQGLVDGVREALADLSQIADIVFLTAMTPAHYDTRRRLLDAAGLRQPMIATLRSKGGVVAELHDFRPGAVVFVDDIPPNLVSVSRSLPQAKLVHLMANTVFRSHLPPLPPGAVPADGWPDAARTIRALFKKA